MAQNGKFPSPLWAPVVPKFKNLRILNRTTLSFIFTFFYKDLWKQTNFTPLTMDHINNMLKLQLSHYLNCDGGKIYMSPSITDSMDWVWVNSRSWWRTGRPGVLQFMGSQRVGHDWAELKQCLRSFSCHLVRFNISATINQIWFWKIRTATQASDQEILHFNNGTECL